MKINAIFLSVSVISCSIFFPGLNAQADALLPNQARIQARGFSEACAKKIINAGIVNMANELAAKQLSKCPYTPELVLLDSSHTGFRDSANPPRPLALVTMHLPSAPNEADNDPNGPNYANYLEAKNRYDLCNNDGVFDYKSRSYFLMKDASSPMTKDCHFQYVDGQSVDDVTTPMQ